MTVAERVQRKNFLTIEGRLLASGGRGQLTAGEWFYQYEQIKDDLVGVQRDIFAALAAKIRARYPRFVMDAIAE